MHVHVQQVLFAASRPYLCSFDLVPRCTAPALQIRENFAFLPVKARLHLTPPLLLHDGGWRKHRPFYHLRATRFSLKGVLVCQKLSLSCAYRENSSLTTVLRTVLTCWSYFYQLLMSFSGWHLLILSCLKILSHIKLSNAAIARKLLLLTNLFQQSIKIILYHYFHSLKVKVIWFWKLSKWQQPQMFNLIQDTPKWCILFWPCCHKLNPTCNYTWFYSWFLKT